MKKRDAFIGEFEAIRPDYETYTKKLVLLLIELLDIKRIKCHSIDGRTKTTESFRDKIRRPDKLYKNPLKEITDLSGTRIILYYSSDISKIEQMIYDEFQVIEKVTDHTPEKYAHNQLGYVSWHYVIKPKKSRITLPEWSNFRDFKSEIQVRTLLQHSWASASHALQYKREKDIPIPLRRRMSRLASLFELADDEFDAIRHEQVKASKAALAALKTGKGDVEINADNLSIFVNNWKRFESLIKRLTAWGYKFDDLGKTIDEKSVLGGVTTECQRLNIRTIKQLEEAIKGDHMSYFKALHTEVVSDPSDHWHVSKAFILELLIIRAFAKDFKVSDLRRRGWNDDIASKVIQTAKADAKL